MSPGQTSVIPARIKTGSRWYRPRDLNPHDAGSPIFGIGASTLFRQVGTVKMVGCAGLEPAKAFWPSVLQTDAFAALPATRTIGGQGRIRTCAPVKTSVFETDPIGHSGTCPENRIGASLRTSSFCADPRSHPGTRVTRRAVAGARIHRAAPRRVAISCCQGSCF